MFKHRRKNGGKMVKAWVEKEIEEPPRICEERKKGLSTKDSASLKRGSQWG